MGNEALSEARKALEATPEYKDYLKAEDFADEKYKAKDKAYVLLDKADKVVKTTPEYKTYKEACDDGVKYKQNKNEKIKLEMKYMA